MEWRKTMERAKIVKGEMVELDTNFLAVYMETSNACLILLSEREDKLGTLAIAVPKPRDMLGPPSSSVLLGDRNAISARMFAEYIASRKGKIALASIYLEKVNEMQAQSVFMKLIEKVVQAEAEKEGTAT
jgi:hypothetical protein